MNIQLKTLTMKTKITLLAFICLISTSCVTDYINDHNNNDNDVEFTETNFAYEPQLYEQYLNRELFNANKKLDSLKESGADYNQLANLNDTIEYLNAERNNALNNIEDLVFKKPIPCPDETVAFELCYPALDKLGFSVDVEIISYLVSTIEGQEEVYNFGDSQILSVPGLEDFATYQDINLNDFTGKLTFKIERKDLLGNVVLYGIVINK